MVDRIIIVFSTTNDADLKQRSFEVGASAFVCKGTGDLLSTINACVTTKVDARGPHSTRSP